MGEVAHGPRVAGRQVLLFAFMDDHLTLIVGHRRGRHEDVLRGTSQDLRAHRRRSHLLSSEQIEQLRLLTNTDMDPLLTRAHPARSVNDRGEVLDLYPLVDEHTGQTIDQAIGILALLRGISTVERATRLHLITRLIRELETRRPTAITAAHERGYTPTEIAVLFDLP